MKGLALCFSVFLPFTFLFLYFNLPIRFFKLWTDHPNDLFLYSFVLFLTHTLIINIKIYI